MSPNVEANLHFSSIFCKPVAELLHSRKLSIDAELYYQDARNLDRYANII